jgi:hypothetical protein
MLAYYVEWQMRQALVPILFDDDDQAAAAAAWLSVVAPAQRARIAQDLTKLTADENSAPQLPHTVERVGARG